MAPQKRDDRNPFETQLDGDLRRLQQQDDPSNWNLQDLQTLLKVARALSNEPTDADRVEDILAVAIRDQYDDERQRGVARIWFGLDPSPRERSTSTARHHAAHEYSVRYRDQHGLGQEVAYDTYRTKYLGPVFFPGIAKALSERYSALEAEQTEASPSVAPPRRSPHRVKHLVVAAFLALAAAVGSVWVLAELSQPADTTPSLAELARKANRQLSYELTPPPSTAASVLGFGDGKGRRAVYPYTSQGWASRAPRLNSYVDLQSGPPASKGDERQFIGVKAMPFGVKYQEGNWRRSAAIPSDKRVGLHIYINNSAPRQPDCSTWKKVEWLATNVRLRLAVWSAPEGRLHVIRAWIASDSTTPRWITDAVAVRTDASTRLAFDPHASWQYAYLPLGFRGRPALNSTDVLKPGGMKVGHGWIGGCYANRVYVILFFNQKR